MPTIPSFLNFAKTQGWSLIGNLPFMVGVKVRVLGMYVCSVQECMYVGECLHV